MEPPGLPGGPDWVLSDGFHPFPSGVVIKGFVLQSLLHPDDAGNFFMVEQERQAPFVHHMYKEL